MNRNVKIAILFASLMNLSKGIWAFTTLSLYLKALTNKTSKVGFAEGLQGCVQAIFAFGAGLLVDSTRRDSVLKVGGIIGLLAVATTLLGLVGQFPWLSSSDHQYAVLLIALGLWGCFQGIFITAVDSIFADSVSTGERTKLYTFRFVIGAISNTTGPFIALCLFSYHDKEHQTSLETLRDVFVVGVVLNIIPCIVLFLFNDDHSLGIDSEPHFTRVSSSSNGVTRSGFDYEPLDGENESVNSNNNSEQELHHLSVNCNNHGGNEFSRSLSLQEYSEIEDNKHFVKHHHVPGILVASDIVSGLGSGMTVKFFPLYFREELDFSPVHINAVYIALSVFTILTSFLVHRFSNHIGRIQASLLFCYVGAASLGTMGVLDGFLRENKSLFILPLYYLSALVHSTRPVKKSVLMDFTKKNSRGFYNSFDSITRFGWSGSAVVGGLVVDHFGYYNLFLITAALQAVSTSILVLLIPVVPVREIPVITVVDDDNGERDIVDTS